MSAVDDTDVLRRVQPAIAARDAHPDVMFWCPGCECCHGIWTTKAAHNGARWEWNGDMLRPTFHPSVLIEGRDNGAGFKTTPRCHSFVKDGKIEFLADCSHSLAGQTVSLAPF